MKGPLWLWEVGDRVCLSKTTPVARNSPSLSLFVSYVVAEVKGRHPFRQRVRLRGHPEFNERAAGEWFSGAQFVPDDGNERADGGCTRVSGCELGRFQRLTGAQARLLEADAYLSSSDQAAELELSQELKGVAAKVKARRAEVLGCLDEHGLRLGLTAEERARLALARLPEPERLLLAAEQVMGCRPGAEGERLASLIRGLVCKSSP